MGTTIVRASRIYELWLSVVACSLLHGAPAALAPVRQPAVLFAGPVQAAALADTTLYVVQSNTLYHAPLAHPEWTAVGRIPLAQAGEAIHRLRAVAGDPDQLFALTRRRVCLSRDGGLTWAFRRLDAEDCSLNDICPHPAIRDGLLLATSDGAWLSRDHGQSFERFFARADDGENHVQALAMTADGYWVYVATRAGLFCSMDGGQTFSRISGLPRAPVTTLAQAPVNGSALAFVAAGRLFFTSTKLKAYRAVSLDHDFSRCIAAAIPPNGTDIIWSSPDGVMHGVEWLAGRETEAIAEGMMARFPSMDQIARDVTNMVGMVSFSREQPVVAEDAPGSVEPAPVEDDVTPGTKPFVPKPVVDLEAQAQD
jgi:hypothetical protein